MPRSTATRRRWRVALTITSVGVLAGAWLWYSGLETFGITKPGGCVWHAKDGSELRLTADEALAKFEAFKAAGTSLKKAQVSCSVLPISAGSKELSERGLTPNADRLFVDVRKVFGEVSYGGFAPGGVNTGHVAGSDHYEGRAIDFFFRPHTKPERRLAGWQLAQWAVLHADDYGITMVIFDEKVWSRSASSLGWRNYTHPDGPTDNVIKRHLDHVHISVG